MPADSTTDEIATWQVITGSARGAAHRASGLPNQDAVASQDGPGGVVVAIADGHGQIRHFRSADGAALAVHVACRAASHAAAGLAADAAGDEEAAQAGQQLARAVVADWRYAVADQLEVRPYTTEERWILDRSGRHACGSLRLHPARRRDRRSLAGVRADRRRRHARGVPRWQFLLPGGGRRQARRAADDQPVPAGRAGVVPDRRARPAPGAAGGAAARHRRIRQRPGRRAVAAQRGPGPGRARRPPRP